MAIQWADSFSRYGTGSGSVTPLNDGLPYNNWNSQALTDPDPLAAANGERCFRIGTGAANFPININRIALPTPTAGVVGFACRVWFASFGSDNISRPSISFMTSTPTPLVSLQAESNGALTIYNNLTLTAIDTTVSPVVSTNSWNHVEFKYTPATGACEVRLNGVEILSGNGSTTGATVAFLLFAARNSLGLDQTVYIKDLVVWDGSGTYNNDFLGSVVVRRKAPNADVTLGGWLPSTGSTGFNLLAKTTPNDTTYLSADDTPPAAMQYALENLPDDVTSVKGVISVVRARKIDGGDATLQTSLLSNGDADAGADRPVTTAFTYWFDVSETDPDTGVPWTPEGFDAAEVEIDRTT